MTEQTATSRRAVVVGGVAAVAVGALAACATYGKTSKPPGGGTTPTGPVTLGKTTDIPVGGGKVFADAEVVVTQPAAGTFKGFSAICQHLGCTVGDVSGGTINCPCHGSKYRIADGSIANGPTTKPLPPVAITVTGDTIATS
jgi:Rieske Fe-S protein